MLRPRDLVALDVLGYGLELRDDGDGAGPGLVPVGDEPRLEVRLPFQHLGEEAFYRVESSVPATVFDELTPLPAVDQPPPSVAADPNETVTGPPVQALAAYGSRLVFDVPAGERIGLSSEGVLAAMSRLPLRVVPLATPRVAPRRPPVLGGDILLPGGLVLARTEAGLVLQRASGAVRRAARRAAAADRRRDSAVDRLLTASGALRTARRLMSTEATLDLVSGSAGADLHVPGGIGDLLPLPVPPVRPPRVRPRAPLADETAIEAPYRLLLSPSVRGGFAHATTPRTAPGDPDRVELWHSRLGVRRVDREGVVTVDERADRQRIVRAVWARDKEEVPEPDVPSTLPFRMSLDGLDRVMLVRQSADPALAVPEPVDAERLFLSSLGAWLDLAGRWDAGPYAEEGLPSILAWDHIAPMGRDQFVRVVYPGYLFPFGHRCALVKITERKILAEVDPTQPQARLYQRKFLVVSEPLRTYPDRQNRWFTQVAVRPLTTPDLDDPLGGPALADDISPEHLFWPSVGGAKFRFVLDSLDHDGRRVLLRAPLLFVAAHLGSAAEKAAIIEAYATDDRIPGDGQSIAYAPSTRPGDTAYETIALHFTGRPGEPGELSSDPRLVTADLVVPAMRHLAPVAPPVTVSYAQPYEDEAFGGANAGPQVVLELATETFISFGSTAENAKQLQLIRDRLNPQSALTNEITAAKEAMVGQNCTSRTAAGNSRRHRGKPRQERCEGRRWRQGRRRWWWRCIGRRPAMGRVAARCGGPDAPDQ